MSDEFVTNVRTEPNGDRSGERDLFDPERLRLSQNFVDLVGVRKILTTVRVSKPHRQMFVRVHPDPKYRLDTLVLELKEERETYLVDLALGSELPGELVAVTLFTAITRQNDVFLWPARLPDPDGRQNRWSESARQAAKLAMSQWVRMAANMSLGAYEISVATGDLPEPQWPEKNFQELLQIAFYDRFIRQEDERENYLSRLLKDSSEPVVVTDDEHRLLAANLAALTLFGISQKNLNNFSIDAFLRHDQVHCFEREGPPFMQGPERLGECQIRPLNGKPKVVAFSFQANFLLVAKFRDAASIQ